MADPGSGEQPIGGYCSTTEVRNLTNIEVADLLDEQIQETILLATAELNSAINCRVYREPVLYIDQTRQNYIQGTQTEFYVRNFRGKFIADYDNDGFVDTDDLIVYVVDSVGNESIATVASIDADNGKFTLSTAPAAGRYLYVTYAWSYVSEANPSKTLRLACALLSAAYCYAKINFGRAPQVAFGNLKIYRHMDAFDKYFKMYQNIVNRINAKQADWVEAAPQAGSIS